MGDVPNQVFVEKKMRNCAHQEEDFFVLDIEKLCLDPNTNNNKIELDDSHDPRISMASKLKKALSRKGSQRFERKISSTDETTNVVSSMSGDGSAGTTTEQLAGRRHLTGRRATSPSWFDPRRVLLFFATLSSLGTIILLYFTLSMDKMDGGDANQR